MCQGGEKWRKARGEAEEVLLALQGWPGYLVCGAGVLQRLYDGTPPLQRLPPSPSESRKGLTTWNGQDWNSPPGPPEGWGSGIGYVLRRLGLFKLGGTSLVCFAREPLP